MSELLNPRSTPSPTRRHSWSASSSTTRQRSALSIAQRSKVFCTEDPELRRLARVMEVDVVNRVEYIERFVKEQARSAHGAEDTPPPPDIGEDA